MRTKRIPIKVVVVSVGFILLASALVIIYLPPIEPVRSKRIIVRQSLAILLSEEVQTTAIEGGLEPAVDHGAQPDAPQNTGMDLPQSRSADSWLGSADKIPWRPVRLLIPELGVDETLRAVAMNPTVIDNHQLLDSATLNGYFAAWNASADSQGADDFLYEGLGRDYQGFLRDLIDKDPGLEIVVYRYDLPYSYPEMQLDFLPDNIQPIEIRLDNARWIFPVDKERATIIAAWPSLLSTYRPIVVAKPIGEDISAGS